MLSQWRSAITATGIFALGSLLFGCGEKQVGPPAKAGHDRYADLPGLRASADPELQGELAMLEQEQATPAQLAKAQQALTDVAYRQQTPLEQLRQAFPLLGRQLLAGQIDAVYPTERVRLGAAARERTREILRRQTQGRELFRFALRPQEGGLGVPLDRGLLASLDCLEPFRIGCRLEVLDAADDISEHRLESALEPLEVLLRATRTMAAEKNVTTRLAAAEMRGEALRIIDTIAAHRFAPLRDQLLGLVRDELEAWPADADVWIGERANGLHTYELVRDGNFLSLLSPEEIARLETKGILEATAQAAVQQVDADERFYLAAMRKLIAASRLPYFQRVPVLQELRQELKSREASGQFPLIAGTVLLTDFEQAQLRQAEDRARFEAWQVGLAISVRMTTPTTTAINSLTGRPFIVSIDGRRFVVSDILPDPTYTVAMSFPRDDPGQPAPPTTP